jgi:hypothetical protein
LALLLNKNCPSANFAHRDSDILKPKKKKCLSQSNLTTTTVDSNLLDINYFQY